MEIPKFELDQSFHSSFHGTREHNKGKFCLFSCRYEGNPHLRQGNNQKKHNKIVLGTSIGVLAILVGLSIASVLLIHHYRKNTNSKSDRKGM